MKMMLLVMGWVFGCIVVTLNLVPGILCEDWLTVIVAAAVLCILELVKVVGLALLFVVAAIAVLAVLFITLPLFIERSGGFSGQLIPRLSGMVASNMLVRLALGVAVALAFFWFVVVTSAWTLQLTAYLVDGFVVVDFEAAIWASLIISLVYAFAVCSCCLSLTTTQPQQPYHRFIHTQQQQEQEEHQHEAAL